MSGYINFDHAGWVESQIRASKRHKPTAKDRRNMEKGLGWHAAPNVLTPFQSRAFNILGIVGGGIYNAPIAWDSVSWRDRNISCGWAGGGLGTFDNTSLTNLVFLCHEARIRGCIVPRTFRHVEIMLSERKAEGLMHDRHPNLDEAIAAWRENFSSDHSIAFKEAAPIAAAPTISRTSFGLVDYASFKTMKMVCIPLVRHGRQTEKSIEVSSDGDPTKVFSLPKKEMILAGETGPKFFVVLIPQWLARKVGVSDTTIPALAKLSHFTATDRAAFQANLEIAREVRNAIRHPKGKGSYTSDREMGGANA